MDWTTLLYASLPLAATMATLILTQRFERRRAAESRQHDLARLAEEQRHATAMKLFDQRFQTYFEMLTLGRHVVDAGYVLQQRVETHHQALQSAIENAIEPARSEVAEAETKAGAAVRALTTEMPRASLLASEPLQDALKDFRDAAVAFARPEEGPGLASTTESPRLATSFEKRDASLDRLAQKKAQLKFVEALYSKYRDLEHHERLVTVLMSEELRGRENAVSEQPSGALTTELGKDDSAHALEAAE